jgi:uncharacterized protein (TIGR03435 family)
MFERYTERARRVLFFARYEASVLGSLSIETEHLLLGLLREGKGITSRLFARSHLSLERIRGEIVSRSVPREKVPTSVEIPFAGEAKRVLSYAAEEADRLLHNYIGTEHLLLGILREERSVAASILMNHGLRLDEVREAIVQLLHEDATGGRVVAPARFRIADAPALASSLDVRISPTRRSEDEGTSETGGPGRWSAEGISLKTVLSKVSAVPPTRIELPASLDDERRYDVFVALPREESRETVNRLIQESLQWYFKVAITMESRPMDVYVLTAPNGTTAPRKASGDDFTATGAGATVGSWDVAVRRTQDGPPTEEEIRNDAEALARALMSGSRGDARFSLSGVLLSDSTMEQFCAHLEHGLGRPVIDATNLAGTYDLQVRSERHTTEEFLEALRAQLGLVATPDRRDVTMLVMRQG